MSSKSFPKGTYIENQNTIKDRKFHHTSTCVLLTFEKKVNKQLT